MTIVADLDLPTFDYSDESLTGRRFHDELRKLRERTWLARADPLGWVVLDRDAVSFILRTPSATFPGSRMLEALGVTEGPLYERMKRSLLGLDGGDHRRLRQLVQPAFTPQAAGRHRPAMREHLATLFDRVAAHGRCDFVESFAKPYPALTIATVMGAPLEDAPRLHEWANLIQAQFDPIRLVNERPVLERAVAEFEEYARNLVRLRHADPRDDLISTLIRLEQQGDRLSEQECVDLVYSVLVGGVDTTQSQLAHGIRLFAERPEQWRLLAQGPALAAAAVEEVLRFEPITPFTGRVAREDIEYRGVTFPAGTLIFACAATANRDHEGHLELDSFDLTADRGRAKPLTFGAGPHFCLGANLARAELQEAFAFLARHMPQLELAGDPVYDSPLGVYGMRKLPIRFRPAAATAR
jgi:cytochrome P450